MISSKITSSFIFVAQDCNNNTLYNLGQSYNNLEYAFIM